MINTTPISGVKAEMLKLHSDLDDFIAVPLSIAFNFVPLCLCA